jgi:hypothetical protein
VGGFLTKIYWRFALWLKKLNCIKTLKPQTMVYKMVVKNLLKLLLLASAKARLEKDYSRFYPQFF